MKQETKIYYQLDCNGYGKHSEAFETLEKTREQVKLRQKQRVWQNVEIYKITTETTKELIDTLPGIMPLPENIKDISFQNATKILENCKYWMLEGNQMKTADITSKTSLSFRTMHGTLYEYTKAKCEFFVSTDPTKPFLGIQSLKEEFVHIFVPGLGEP